MFSCWFLVFMEQNNCIRFKKRSLCSLTFPGKKKKRKQFPIAQMQAISHSGSSGSTCHPGNQNNEPKSHSLRRVQGHPALPLWCYYLVKYFVSICSHTVSRVPRWTLTICFISKFLFQAAIAFSTNKCSDIFAINPKVYLYLLQDKKKSSAPAWCFPLKSISESHGHAL